MGQDTLTRVEIRTADALERWLEVHHAQGDSVWLVTWKKHAGAAYVSREAVLDALVAWGWIDGRRMALDADRTIQLISPRKQRAWAASYKARAARLEAKGKMQPPGRAAVEAGKASGQWTFSDDVDALHVPDDLAATLEELGARARFEAMAPSYRRNVLRWIKSAKQAPTRARRLAATAEATARGEKLPQL